MKTSIDQYEINLTIWICKGLSLFIYHNNNFEEGT
jgi:hypothetical protein